MADVVQEQQVGKPEDSLLIDRRSRLSAGVRGEIRDDINDALTDSPARTPELEGGLPPFEWNIAPCRSTSVLCPVAVQQMHISIPRIRREERPNGDQAENVIVGQPRDP